jgi:hypothetical protein
MAQVEQREPADMVVQQPRQLDAQVEQRSGDHTYRQAVHAPTRHQEQRPADDAQIVQEWRQRGQEEMLVCVQHRHEQPADREDHCGNQDQAHQVSGERLVFGREARRDKGAHQCRRENGHDYGDEQRQTKGDVNDRADQPPGRCAVVLGQIGGQDRQESGGQGAAGDQREQQIGDVESGVVSIQFAARAEGVADDRLAGQTDDLVQAKGQHHNGG